MRIVVKRQEPPPRKEGPSYPIINGALPSFVDARFYADDGTEMTNVTSCIIEIEPNNVIIAHTTHLVSELDIECEESRSER